MKVDGCVWLELRRHNLRLASGAQEKTRTFTSFRTQVPETCASTNSATWACTRRAVERRCSRQVGGRQCPFDQYCQANPAAPMAVRPMPHRARNRIGSSAACQCAHRAARCSGEGGRVALGSRRWKAVQGCQLGLSSCWKREQTSQVSAPRMNRPRKPSTSRHHHGCGEDRREDDPGGCVGDCGGRYPHHRRLWYRPACFNLRCLPA